jgi:hypothetical protein
MVTMRWTGWVQVIGSCKYVFPDTKRTVLISTSRDEEHGDGIDYTEYNARVK